MTRLVSRLQVDVSAETASRLDRLCAAHTTSRAAVISTALHLMELADAEQTARDAESDRQERIEERRRQR